MVDRYQPFGLLSEADDEDNLARYLQMGGGGVSATAQAPAGYDALGRVAYGMTGAGGVQDAAGLLGGPSLSENLAAGNKLDAALQAVGMAPVVGGAVKGLLGGAKLAAVIPAASFAGKKLPKVENLARVADKFVYHSGVAKDIPLMKDYLEPQHGSWIQEVASNAVDDPEEILSSAKPLVWMSDKPNWVNMKVARQTGKYVKDVTEDDIRAHGHVAMVPRKSDSAENIWYVGSDGLNNGLYSEVKNLRNGETTKAYNTNLFDDGEPFGVERNEYISAQDVEPLLHLTGDDLVKFLKLTGSQNGLLGK